MPTRTMIILLLCLTSACLFVAIFHVETSVFVEGQSYFTILVFVMVYRSPLFGFRRFFREFRDQLSTEVLYVNMRSANHIDTRFIDGHSIRFAIYCPGFHRQLQRLSVKVLAWNIPTHETVLGITIGGAASECTELKHKECESCRYGRNRLPS